MKSADKLIKPRAADTILDDELEVMYSAKVQ